VTRILVARLDSVGDVLVSGPAIRAVAATPGAEVALLCSPEGAAAGRLLPGVDRVLTWSAPWIVDPAPAATPEHVESLAGLLREWAPDEAVILSSFHQSPLPLALLLRLAGVSRITGASTDYAGSLLDVRLRPGEDLVEDQPEPERQLAIARAAGHVLPAGDDGRLAVLAEELPADVQALLPERFVVLHPGAQVEARTWPAERARSCVPALARAGFDVVVTGGPSETGLTASVAGVDGVDLGGRLSLGQLATVLAQSEAVVVGNTGPAHLAAAVGAPVVSLFSPVVPAIRWAPYRTPTILLGDQGAACRGSRARDCPIAGHPCLAGVTEHDVVRAVVDLAGRPSLIHEEGVAS
jgi:ADP-heptose:LPS heptosyltransferase